jgi:hypothetical protein
MKHIDITPAERDAYFTEVPAKRNAVMTKLGCCNFS